MADPAAELSLAQRARALRAHEFLIFAILLVALALCLAAAPFAQPGGAPPNLNPAPAPIPGRAA